MGIVRNLWQYVARHHNPSTHPHVVWPHDPCARPHDPWGNHVACQHNPCTRAHVAWPNDPPPWPLCPCCLTPRPLASPPRPLCPHPWPLGGPCCHDPWARHHNPCTHETTLGSAMFPATTTPLREMLVEVQHTCGIWPDSCMPYIVDICGPLTPAMSDATDTSLHVSIPTELLRPTPTVLTPMPVVLQESGSPSKCIYDWNQDISSMFPSLPTTNPSIKPTPKRLLTSDDVIHH